jgi:hypothetical protein
MGNLNGLTSQDAFCKYIQCTMHIYIDTYIYIYIHIYTVYICYTYNCIYPFVTVSPVVVSAIFVFPSHKKQCIYVK